MGREEDRKATAGLRESCQQHRRANSIVFLPEQGGEAIQDDDQLGMLAHMRKDRVEPSPTLLRRNESTVHPEEAPRGQGRYISCGSTACQLGDDGTLADPAFPDQEHMAGTAMQSAGDILKEPLKW